MDLFHIIGVDDKLTSGFLPRVLPAPSLFQHIAITTATNREPFCFCKIKSVTRLKLPRMKHHTLNG